MVLTFKVKDKSNDRYIGTIEELAKIVQNEFAYNSEEKLFYLSTDKYEITDINKYN